MLGWPVYSLAWMGILVAGLGLKRDCILIRCVICSCELCRQGHDLRPEGVCAGGAAAKPRERREWAGSVGAQGVAFGLVP